MKKFFTFVLAISLSLAIFAGGGSEETTKPAEVSGEFIMEYPSFQQERFGESLILENRPEKVIVLADSALQMAARYDLDPIAHSGLTRTIEYPESYNDLPEIVAGMSDLDLESIIAMEPDLLIIGAHFKEDYDAIFAGANIPTYYVLSGPSVVYESVKAESILLAKAFGGEDGEKEVIAEFEAVESRAAAFSEGKESIRTMILFSVPATYHQTSKGYLGSMLAMLPIELLSDAMVGPEAGGTLPMDFEQLITAEPNLLFAISPSMSSSEIIEQAYADQLAKNPDVWGSVKAITEGNIIYLSNEFVTAKGIKVVDSVNTLIDLLEEEM